MADEGALGDFVEGVIFEKVLWGALVGWPAECSGKVSKPDDVRRLATL